MKNELTGIKTHTELKTFIENAAELLINDELTSQKAKVLAQLIKLHSIEIDKAKNEMPYWETNF